MTGYIKHLLAQLRDPDERIREKAARTLEEYGGVAVYGVLEVLGDDNPEVRERAIWVLEAMGQPEALPGLLNQLDDPVEDVRVAAICALKRLDGEDAVDGLRAMLGDRSARVRREAARALGEMHANLGVADLVASLHDADISVARSAANALGEIRGHSALRGLMDVASDLRLDVRLAAIRALGEIGHPFAKSALQPMMLHPHQETRLAVAEALQEIEHHNRHPQQPQPSRVSSNPLAQKSVAASAAKSQRSQLGVTLLIVMILFLLCQAAFSGMMESNRRTEQIAAMQPTARPTVPAHEEPVLRVRASRQPIIGVGFDPAGQVIYSFGQNDREIAHWDALTGQRRATGFVKMEGSEAAVFSSDGLLMAVSGTTGTVTVWNIHSGDQIAKEEEISADYTVGGGVAWSPAHSSLLASSNGDQFHLWETVAPQGIDITEKMPSLVTAVAFSTDGASLAIGMQNGTIELRNLGQNTTVGTLPADTSDAAFLAWNADSTRLASAGLDGKISIWDVENHERLHSIEAAGALLSALAWSSNGAVLLAASTDGVISLWNAREFESLPTITIGGSILCLAWSPDGRQFLIGTNSGDILIFEVPTEG